MILNSKEMLYRYIKTLKSDADENQACLGGIGKMKQTIDISRSDRLESNQTSQIRD